MNPQGGLEPALRWMGWRGASGGDGWRRVGPGLPACGLCGSDFSDRDGGCAATVMA